MSNCQDISLGLDKLSLYTERLGPLPIINHFLGRLGFSQMLDQFFPTGDKRIRLSYAKGLGVLLRSILVDRAPIYSQQETVAPFAPHAFGIEKSDVVHLVDDAVGRALDQLFDADRGTMMTELVVTTAQRFGLSFDELHNDSTSVRFSGQYRQAKGRSMRGKLAPFITYGYSQDHRPDLKQLVFILTTSVDGAVPVQFRCAAGNTNDSRTHEQTWDALCAVSGRTDFLYVADSKLCNREALDYIASRHGRLVCVIPRSRHEDGEFRKWIQTNEPAWTLVWDRPNPRRKGGPRDRWWVYQHEIPSVEGWPVIWVQSSLLRTRQEHRRRERIAEALVELKQYNAKLKGPRPRKRSYREMYDDIDAMLKKHHVTRYISYSVEREEEHSYRQETSGRPTAKTRYTRKTRQYFQLQWRVDQSAIDYDHRSDGMYPLLTNDPELSPAEVLKAHKRQPSIEKRFEQTKSVFQIAPVLLKNEGRIEALFHLYFIALLVQALIEREIRQAMVQRGIEALPLYPEERENRRPTCEQIFRLFSTIERNTLLEDDRMIKVFSPKLTPLQLQLLNLLGVPESAYF